MIGGQPRFGQLIFAISVPIMKKIMEAFFIAWLAHLAGIFSIWFSRKVTSYNSWKGILSAMETAGLAVGIAGLAGLFGACMGAMKHLHSYKTPGHESSYIIAAFDADKL